jgi:hypothetical protein
MCTLLFNRYPGSPLFAMTESDGLKLLEQHHGVVSAYRKFLNLAGC